MTFSRNMHVVSGGLYLENESGKPTFQLHFLDSHTWLTSLNPKNNFFSDMIVHYGILNACTAVGEQTGPVTFMLQTVCSLVGIRFLCVRVVDQLMLKDTNNTCHYDITCAIIDT